MRQNGGEATHLSQWAGLGKRHPVVASAFAFLMLAFAGIPLTSGFVSKFAVFSAAVGSGATGAVLAVVGVLCSAITVFVYARVIVLMFFSEPPEETVEVITPSAMTTFSIAIGTLTTLALGVVPSSLLDLADRASQFVR